MTTARNPAHLFTFAESKDGRTGPSTIIGAGWQREDGSISLRAKLVPNVSGFLNLKPRKHGVAE